jgi:hypothetical protein
MFIRCPLTISFTVCGVYIGHNAYPDRWANFPQMPHVSGCNDRIDICGFVLRGKYAVTPYGILDDTIEGMIPTKAYDEIVDLLALSPHLLEFQPSEQSKARVWELVGREKSGTLTPDEKAELDQYGQLEHLLRLAKARARGYGDVE